MPQHAVPSGSDGGSDVDLEPLLQRLKSASGEPDFKAIYSECVKRLTPVLCQVGATEKPKKHAISILAREFTPFLVQLAKHSLLRLASAEDALAGPSLVNIAVLAIDGLERLRSSLVGRPLEVEFQRYALIRRLAALKLNAEALGQGWLLHVSLCRELGRTNLPCSDLTGVGSGDACDVIAAPAAGKESKESVMLVVGCVTSLVLCSAETGSSPAGPHTAPGKIATLLTSVEPWLRQLDPDAQPKHRESLFRAAFKFCAHALQRVATPPAPSRRVLNTPASSQRVVDPPCTHDDVALTADASNQSLLDLCRSVLQLCCRVPGCRASFAQVVVKLSSSGKGDAGGSSIRASSLSLGIYEAAITILLKEDQGTGDHRATLLPPLLGAYASLAQAGGNDAVIRATAFLASSRATMAQSKDPMDNWVAAIAAFYQAGLVVAALGARALLCAGHEDLRERKVVLDAGGSDPEHQPDAQGKGDKRRKPVGSTASGVPASGPAKGHDHDLACAALKDDRVNEAMAALDAACASIQSASGQDSSCTHKGQRARGGGQSDAPCGHSSEVLLWESDAARDNSDEGRTTELKSFRSSVAAGATTGLYLELAASGLLRSEGAASLLVSLARSPSIGNEVGQWLLSAAYNMGVEAFNAKRYDLAAIPLKAVHNIVLDKWAALQPGEAPQQTRGPTAQGSHSNARTGHDSSRDADAQGTPAAGQVAAADATRVRAYAECLCRMGLVTDAAQALAAGIHGWGQAALGKRGPEEAPQSPRSVAAKGGTGATRDAGGALVTGGSVESLRILLEQFTKVGVLAHRQEQPEAETSSGQRAAGASKTTGPPASVADPGRPPCLLDTLQQMAPRLPEDSLLYLAKEEMRAWQAVHVRDPHAAIPCVEAAIRAHLRAFCWPMSRRPLLRASLLVEEGQLALSVLARAGTDGSILAGASVQTAIDSFQEAVTLLAPGWHDQNGPEDPIETLDGLQVLATAHALMACIRYFSGLEATAGAHPGGCGRDEPLHHVCEAVTHCEASMKLASNSTPAPEGEDHSDLWRTQRLQGTASMLVTLADLAGFLGDCHLHARAIKTALRCCEATRQQTNQGDAPESSGDAAAGKGEGASLLRAQLADARFQHVLPLGCQLPHMVPPHSHTNKSPSSHPLSFSSGAEGKRGGAQGTQDSEHLHPSSMDAGSCADDSSIPSLLSRLAMGQPASLLALGTLSQEESPCNAARGQQEDSEEGLRAAIRREQELVSQQTRCSPGSFRLASLRSLLAARITITGAYDEALPDALAALHLRLSLLPCSPTRSTREDAGEASSTAMPGAGDADEAGSINVSSASDGRHRAGDDGAQASSSRNPGSGGARPGTATVRDSSAFVGPGAQVAQSGSSPEPGDGEQGVPGAMAAAWCATAAVAASASRKPVSARGEVTEGPRWGLCLWAAPSYWRLAGEVLESLWQVGMLYRRMGMPGDAERHLMEGALLSRELCAAPHAEAMFLAALGEIRRKKHRWSQAEEDAAACRTILEEEDTNPSSNPFSHSSKDMAVGGGARHPDGGSTTVPRSGSCHACLAMAAVACDTLSGDLARRRGDGGQCSPRARKGHLGEALEHYSAAAAQLVQLVDECHGEGMAKVARAHLQECSLMGQDWEACRDALPVGGRKGLVLIARPSPGDIATATQDGSKVLQVANGKGHSKGGTAGASKPVEGRKRGSSKNTKELVAAAVPEPSVESRLSPGGDAATCTTMAAATASGSHPDRDGEVLDAGFNVTSCNTPDVPVVRKRLRKVGTGPKAAATPAPADGDEPLPGPSQVSGGGKVAAKGHRGHSRAERMHENEDEGGHGLEGTADAGIKGGKTKRSGNSTTAVHSVDTVEADHSTNTHCGGDDEISAAALEYMLPVASPQMRRQRLRRIGEPSGGILESAAGGNGEAQAPKGGASLAGDAEMLGEEGSGYRASADISAAQATGDAVGSGTVRPRAGRQRKGGAKETNEEGNGSVIVHLEEEAARPAPAPRRSSKKTAPAAAAACVDAEDMVPAAVDSAPPRPARKGRCHMDDDAATGASAAEAAVVDVSASKARAGTGKRRATPAPAAVDACSDALEEFARRGGDDDNDPQEIVADASEENGGPKRVGRAAASSRGRAKATTVPSAEPATAPAGARRTTCRTAAVPKAVGRGRGRSGAAAAASSRDDEVHGEELTLSPEIPRNASHRSATRGEDGLRNRRPSAASDDEEAGFYDRVKGAAGGPVQRNKPKAVSGTCRPVPGSSAEAMAVLPWTGMKWDGSEVHNGARSCFVDSQAVAMAAARVLTCQGRALQALGSLREASRCFQGALTLLNHQAAAPETELHPLASMGGRGCHDGLETGGGQLGASDRQESHAKGAPSKPKGQSKEAALKGRATVESNAVASTVGANAGEAPGLRGSYIEQLLARADRVLLSFAQVDRDDVNTASMSVCDSSAALAAALYHTSRLVLELDEEEGGAGAQVGPRDAKESTLPRVARLLHAAHDLCPAVPPVATAIARQLAHVYWLAACIPRELGVQGIASPVVAAADSTVESLRNAGALCLHASVGGSHSLQQRILLSSRAAAMTAASACAGSAATKDSSSAATSGVPGGITDDSLPPHVLVEMAKRLRPCRLQGPLARHPTHPSDMRADNATVSALEATVGNSVPPGTAVCTLAASPDGTALLISRITAGRPPIFVSIPSRLSRTLPPRGRTHMAKGSEGGEAGAVRPVEGEASTPAGKPPVRIRLDFEDQGVDDGVEEKNDCNVDAQGAKGQGQMHGQGQGQANGGRANGTRVKEDSHLSSLLRDFGCILEHSSQSTAGGVPLQTQEDKAAWWQGRIALDGRLRQLLSELETGCLGPWKCLLLAEPMRNHNHESASKHHRSDHGTSCPDHVMHAICTSLARTLATMDANQEGKVKIASGDGRQSCQDAGKASKANGGAEEKDKYNKGAVESSALTPVAKEMLRLLLLASPGCSSDELARGAAELLCWNERAVREATPDAHASLNIPPRGQEGGGSYYVQVEASCGEPGALRTSDKGGARTSDERAARIAQVFEQAFQELSDSGAFALGKEPSDSHPQPAQSSQGASGAALQAKGKGVDGGGRGTATSAASSKHGPAGAGRGVHASNGGSSLHPGDAQGVGNNNRQAGARDGIQRVLCCHLQRMPLVLILDKNLQALPWESLPILRTSSQSVYRMPSLAAVSAHSLRLRHAAAAAMTAGPKSHSSSSRSGGTDSDGSYTISPASSPTTSYVSASSSLSTTSSFASAASSLPTALGSCTVSNSHPKAKEPALRKGTTSAKAAQVNGPATTNSAQIANGTSSASTSITDGSTGLAGASSAWVPVDLGATYFLLNPGGDLVSTQAALEAFCTAQKGWTGKAGQVPTSQELASVLRSFEMFVYCGHGTGEQYIPARAVRQLPRCSSALLMGCSSGRLLPHGDYDPSGMVLSYLMAGCPAVVANLWDVTDRDIDRFSAAIMSRWQETALISGSATGAPSLSGGRSSGATGGNGGLHKEFANDDDDDDNSSRSSSPTTSHLGKAAMGAKAKKGKTKVPELESNRHLGEWDRNSSQPGSSRDAGMLPPSCIAASIAPSRTVCRLPHLIGAAPVCYGLPAYLCLSDHAD
eukprot:jgi/Mesvir1/12296/Mv00498-RA.2